MSSVSVPVHRLVEYFCVVSYGHELSPVSEAEAEARCMHRIHDGNSFPEKSKSTTVETHSSKEPLISSGPGRGCPLPDHLLQASYKTEVISRFPLNEHKYVPFPPGLSMFCLPDDLTLLHGFPPMPIFYSFATTQANGMKMYGNCLKFYEPVPQEHLDQLIQKDKVMRRKMRKMVRNNGATNSAGSAPASNGSSAPASAASPSSPLDSVSSSQQGKKNSIVSTATDSTSSAQNSTYPNQVHTDQIDGLMFEYDGNDSDNEDQDGLLEYPAQGGDKKAGMSGSAGGDSTTVNSSARSVTVSSPNQRSSSQAASSSIYAPKCIVLLSLYPFINQFRLFLTELYRLSLSPCKLPIERILSNFMLEVPLPPLGEIKVEYSLGEKTMEFARTPSNQPFQFFNYDFLLLFQVLELDKILFLLECLLNEQKILLLSQSISCLTPISEALLQLFYPFSFPHSYIPLLPIGLLDFLYAPMPFLIGIHSSYDEAIHNWLSPDLRSDLIVVDLDQNEIYPFGVPYQPQQSAKQQEKQSGKPPIPQLPSKERKKLLKHLQPLKLRHPNPSELLKNLDLAFSNVCLPDEVDDFPLPSQGSSNGKAYKINGIASPYKKGDSWNNLQFVTVDGVNYSTPTYVAQEFFRVFVSLMKDYRQFLIFPQATQVLPPGPLQHHGSFSAAAGGASTNSMNSMLAPPSPSERSSSSNSSSMPAVSSNPPGSPDPSAPSLDSNSVANPSDGPSTPKSTSLSLVSPSKTDKLPMSPASPPSTVSSTLSSLGGFFGSSFSSLNSAISNSTSASTTREREFSFSSNQSLLNGSSNSDLPFNCTGFLKTLDSTAHSFMTEFMKTQAFAKFIEERVYQFNSSSGSAAGKDGKSNGSNASGSGSGETNKQILYFDESITAKKNRSRLLNKVDTPFLKDKSMEITKTFVPPSPDSSNLTQTNWIYVNFPNQFDPNLISLARFVAPLIKHLPPQRVNGGKYMGSGVGGGVAVPVGGKKKTGMQGKYRNKQGDAAESNENNGNPLAPIDSDNCVINIWLFLHTALCIETKLPQILDLLFQILYQLKNGALPSVLSAPLGVLGAGVGSAASANTSSAPSAPFNNGIFVIDEEIYSQLMYACGCCGVPERSIEILQLMQLSNYNPTDPSVYSMLIQVFSMNSKPLNLQQIKAQLAQQNGENNAESNSSSSSKSALLGGLSRQFHKRLSILGTSSSVPAIPSFTTQKNTLLGRIPQYTLQFEHIFPGLSIQCDDNCPECNWTLHDYVVRMGWTNSSHDYTTQCEKCRERFVARFQIRTIEAANVENETQPSASPAAPDPSAPPSVAPPAREYVYCEYLSPRVLQKEIIHLLDNKPARWLCTAQFRTGSYSIFWNLMWHFTNLHLPVETLLDPQTIPELGTDEVVAAGSNAAPGGIQADGAIAAALQSRLSVSAVMLGLGPNKSKHGDSGASSPLPPVAENATANSSSSAQVVPAPLTIPVDDSDSILLPVSDGRERSNSADRRSSPEQSTLVAPAAAPRSASNSASHSRVHSRSNSIEITSFLAHHPAHIRRQSGGLSPKRSELRTIASMAAEVTESRHTRKQSGVIARRGLEEIQLLMPEPVKRASRQFDADLIRLELSEMNEDGSQSASSSMPHSHSHPHMSDSSSEPALPLIAESTNTVEDNENEDSAVVYL